MAEKTINFKASEELHKEIKVKIAYEGLTLKEYIVKLINDDLKREKGE